MSHFNTQHLTAGMIAWLCLCSTAVQAANVIQNGNFEASFSLDGANMVPDGWTVGGGDPPDAPVVEMMPDNGPRAGGSTCARFLRITNGASGRTIALNQTLAEPLEATDYESIELMLDVKVMSHNLEAGGWVSPAFEWPLYVQVNYTLASDPSQSQAFKHGFYVDPPGDGSIIADPGSGIIAEFEDTLVPQGAWTMHTFDLLNDLPDLGTITSITVGGAGWAYEGIADNIELNAVPVSLVVNGDFEDTFTTNVDGDDVPVGWTVGGGDPPVPPHVYIMEDNGPRLSGSQCAHFIRPTGSSSGRHIVLSQTLAEPIVASAYASLELMLDVKVISHNLEAGGWVSPAFEWPVFVRVDYRLASDPTQTQAFKHGFYVDPPGDGSTDADPGSGIIAEYEDTEVQAGIWTMHTINLLDKLPDVGEIYAIQVGAAGWAYEGMADNIAITGTLGQTCETVSDCADQDGDGIRDSNCLFYACEAGSCVETPIPVADVGGANGDCPPDQAVDGNDRFHVLNCFSNSDTLGNFGYPCEPAPPGAMNLDPGGPSASCIPDGVCDANDAYLVLNVFSGETACSCDAGPAPSAPQTVSESADLRLQATAPRIAPNDTVEVDVLLSSDLKDLRGYQLHLGVSGGQSGILELIDVYIDPQLDPVFAGLGAFTGFNTHTSQMLCGLSGDGVAVDADTYLATFTFAATANASGTFVVEVLETGTKGFDGRTFLFPTAAGRRIDLRSASPAVIEVVSRSKQRRR